VRTVTYVPDVAVPERKWFCC